MHLLTIGPDNSVRKLGLRQVQGLPMAPQQSRDSPLRPVPDSEA